VGELHEGLAPGMIATLGFPSQPSPQSSYRKGSWYPLQRMSHRASSKDRKTPTCWVASWVSEADNVLAVGRSQKCRQEECGEGCVAGTEDTLFDLERGTWSTQTVVERVILSESSLGGTCRSESHAEACCNDRKIGALGRCVGGVVPHRTILRGSNDPRTRCLLSSAGWALRSLHAFEAGRQTQMQLFSRGLQDVFSTSCLEGGQHQSTGH
jgi:hypothetical protein